MRFLLCLFLPPVGVLTVRHGSFWLALLLCAFMYLPAMIYGLICWSRRNDTPRGDQQVTINHYHQ